MRPTRRGQQKKEIADYSSRGAEPAKSDAVLRAVRLGRVDRDQRCALAQSAPIPGRGNAPNPTVCVMRVMRPADSGRCCKRAGRPRPTPKQMATAKKPTAQSCTTGTDKAIAALLRKSSANSTGGSPTSAARPPNSNAHAKGNLTSQMKLPRISPAKIVRIAFRSGALKYSGILIPVIFIAAHMPYNATPCPPPPTPLFRW